MAITIYEGKGWKIQAEVENDRVELTSKGILSPIGNYVIKLMNKYYAHERPLMIEDGVIHFSGWIPPMPSEAFNRLFNNEMKAKMTGKYVPEQVSVVGNDDIEFARHWMPSLTTISTPLEELGRKAAEILIKNIEEEKILPVEKINLEARLVIRETTLDLRKR